MKNYDVTLTEVLNTNPYLPNKSVTMAVPFSRVWAVEEWFDCLMSVDWQGKDFWSEVSLLIVADGEAVLAEICKHLNKIPDHAKYRVFKTNSTPIIEYGDLQARRLKICSIWKQMWGLAEGDVILGSEDDSLFPPDAYIKLLTILRSNPKNGFVQASIIGRWAKDLVPHWVYTPSGVMRGWESGAWHEKTVVEIDGGGWYCFAALKEAGNKAEWTCDPTACVGPDVLMVFSIKKLGYNTLGVWDIWVTHLLSESKFLRQNRKKYLNIETVECLEQLLLREVQTGRWDTKSKIIPKPFTVGVTMNTNDQNRLVKVKVIRNFQGAEGLCTRGRFLTVTWARWKQLESRRLAELIPEVEIHTKDETASDTGEDLVELNLDSFDEEEEEEELVELTKNVGPVPPRPKFQVGLKEMANTQEVINMVKPKNALSNVSRQKTGVKEGSRKKG